MIRILIADDSSVIRDGLCGLLKLVSDFEIVGTAKDGLEAVEQAERLNPDVIIMDAQMPNMDGVEATRLIRKAGPIAGILSLSVFSEQMDACIEAGADGYLPKDCDLEELFKTIRQIAAKTEATRKLREARC